MIKNYDFDSVDELMEFISPWGASPDLDGYVFRGHSQEHYQLIPTALRPDKIDEFWKVSILGRPIENQNELSSWQIGAEYSLIREFYRLADKQGLDVPISDRIRKNLVQEFDIREISLVRTSEKWIPNDLLEVVALAQHYGIPTRLLDWTYDINVALYFAFKGAIDKEGKLVIWAINKEYLSFLKGTVNEVNIDFITPHYAGNPNLSAQKGLFTSWPVERLDFFSEANNMFNGNTILVDRRPLDELIKSNLTCLDDGVDIFKRFTLPCKEARKGCNILKKMSYGSARIFPGYQGVADQILQNHKLNMQ